MDVAFIVSSDELLTLLHVFPIKTDAGRLFAGKALCDAEMCDLSGLIEKNLARRIGGELEIEPVLRLIANAISNADTAELHSDAWKIKSPWVNLVCEKYPYNENHWRLTPVNATPVNATPVNAKEVQDI